MTSETFYFDKKIGTLFSPNETNSVINKNLLVAEAEKLGLKIIAIPINSTAELSDASLALLSKNIDMVTQVVDNAVASGFTALAEASRRQEIPLISFDSSLLKEGANIVIGRDYVKAGEEAACKAIKIMRHISPDRIPFSPPKTISIGINEESAAAHRFILPDALRQEVDNINKGTKPIVVPAKILPKRIQLIELVEAPAIEESRKGVLAGLERSGLRANTDYILNIQNAQGDFATLANLIDGAVTNKVDE
ncbi:MAG: hypothetical protein IT292_08300 [Deltaproteobacteria bacterium]|nr:hypothetical protein [Deltaproteobacteria bacterium]